MRGKRNVLGLLECLRVQESEATLTYRADNGVIGERGGFQGDVEDQGVVRQAVEVSDGGEENRGAGDGRNGATVLERVESREERVFVVPHGHDLQDPPG